MNHAGGDFSVNDFNGYLRKEITFHGKSSHAALPQEGINAMSAANLAQHALALTKDRWTADPYVRVHGLLTHAGDAVNVVPDRVTLSYMLRGGSGDAEPSFRPGVQWSGVCDGDVVRD